jgi:hypothetical protein
MNEWQFTLLFHNLPVAESIGNHAIKVIPIDDPLVEEKRSSSEEFCHFIDNFQDQFGRHSKPGLLFIKTEYGLDVESLISFRNILAVSSISQAWANYLSYGSQLEYLKFSDYFDYYPFSLSLDEEYLIAMTPSVTNVDEVGEFSGQSSPGLARAHIRQDFYDVPLFDALLAKWVELYLERKRRNWELLALFRSLEMSYRASSMPYGSQGSIHDYGVNISLWVSTFEILINGQDRHVGVRDVIDMLGSIFFCTSKLRHKRYRAKIGRNNESLTLVQKTYFEMYCARNNFLHGNSVNQKMLFPDGNSKYPALHCCAPIIYKYTLERFIGVNREFNLSDVSDIAAYITHRRSEEALLNMRRKLRRQ